MPAKSWQFAIETLPERPVQQAGMLLGVKPYDGKVIEPIALVLDLATDEFVRVPGLAREGAGTVSCLARDGSRLVVLSPAHGDNGALCLHALATGQQTWYPNMEGERIHATALSPHGHQIATLSTGDDPAHPDDEDASAALINLIDITTGQTNRLWWNSGGWSLESTVSWSPDGTLLAATFLDPEDERATVVIEVDTGIEVARYERAMTLSSANGAWRGNHELIYLDEGFRILVANLDTGAERVIRQMGSAPIALIGDRYLEHAPSFGPGTAGLLSTAIRDRESEPFITIHSPVVITTCDIAVDLAGAAML